MSAYSDYVGTTLATGLVLWLRHGESAGTTMVDSSGAGHNGTYSAAGITYGVTGAILPDSDTAVTYDATSSSTFALVFDPANGDLDLGDGNFSIVTWIKRAGTGQHTIITKGANAYQLRFDASDVLQFLKQGASAVALGPTITDTNWHMIGATRTTAGGASKLYVDGQDVTTPGSALTLSDTNAAFRLLHTGANLDRFPGSIDETSVWKGRVLTDAEMLQLWEHGQGIVTVAIPAVPLTVEAPAPSTALGASLPAATTDLTAAQSAQELSTPLAAGEVTTDAPILTLEQSSSISIPPGIVGVEASPVVSVNIVATIPAAELSADAVAPSLNIEAGVPPASVGADATGGSGYEQAVPAAEITADAPPPSYVVGDERPAPAAEVTTAAAPPGIQIDSSVVIPAAAITTAASPPTIPGVGDDGATGGGFPVRRAPKRLPPEKSVIVKIPAVEISTAAAPADYYMVEPDDDLVIMLVYGS